MIVLHTPFGAAWLERGSMAGAGLKFVEPLVAHDAAVVHGRAGPARRRRKSLPAR